MSPSHDEHSIGDRVRVRGTGDGIIVKRAHPDSPWDWVVESDSHTRVRDLPLWTVAVRNEELE